MLTSIEKLVLTVQLQAPVSVDQLVGFDGRPAGDGGKVLGVAKIGGNAGENISVHVSGTRELIAASMIEAGDNLVSNPDSKPIKAPDGATTVFAQALNTARPGDAVNVLLR